MTVYQFLFICRLATISSRIQKILSKFCLGTPHGAGVRTLSRKSKGRSLALGNSSRTWPLAGLETRMSSKAAAAADASKIRLQSQVGRRERGFIVTMQ